MKKALWIKGFKKMYKILPNGDIYSFVRNTEGRILKPRVSGSGYLMVTLNGVQKYVHQIVAEHYLINRKKTENKIVGFIDGDPLNITISNLFWTDCEGRSAQYFKNKKKSLAKKGMVTSKISKKNLIDIAKLLKNSSVSKKHWILLFNKEKVAELFGINRIALHRLRQTKEFKKIFEKV